MPEPTAAAYLRECIAMLQRGDDPEMMHDPAELRRVLVDHLDLVAIADQWDGDLTALSIAVSDQSKRAHEAEARAAAAEAAVQRVRDLADSHDQPDSQGGQQVARWIRDALAEPVPADALLPLPGGEPVHDRRDDALPPEMEWTTEDEADWRDQHLPPPSFTPLLASQFRAGLEDTRRRMDGAQ